MLNLISLSVFYLLVHFASTVPTIDCLSNVQEVSGLSNVQHIFNGIHSSMRQWGSSLNHNGMSFFLASIPPGTQFFHGTHLSSPVMGMEWLAFEPEHAMIFARARGPPPDRPQGPSELLGQQNHPPSRPPPQHGEPGWLHTYRTKSALNLLYIDGMSAGKTSMGTMDSQDYVLLDAKEDHEIGWDRQRAEALCNLTRDKWGNKIDGFLRMECGFEIILCNFSAHLDTVRITRAGSFGSEQGPGNARNEADLLSFFRAITARYDGIGGGRAVLNYDDFVTIFAYENIDLFNQDAKLPRLRNVSATALHRITSDLDRLITDVNHVPLGKVVSLDWQSVTDQVVTRYAPRLQYLVSQHIQTLDLLKKEIYHVLDPFVDYDERNATAEIDRCTNHFIPELDPQSRTTQSLAARTVTAVSHRICSTLRLVLDDNSHDHAISEITDLIGFLDWTVWKYCDQQCGVDEICFIPIWPFGSREDWGHPSFLNATQMSGRHGYWGSPLNHGPG